MHLLLPLRTCILFSTVLCSFIEINNSRIIDACHFYTVVYLSSLLLTCVCLDLRVLAIIG